MLHAITLGSLGTIQPVDIIFAIFTFALGHLVSRKLRGITLLVQVSVLILKMTKQFMDHHPQLERQLSSDVHSELNKLHMLYVDNKETIG